MPANLLLLSLVLIGAIQGIIISVLLFRNVRIVKGGLFLCILVLLIAMANLNAFLLELPLGREWHPAANLIPLIIFMPIGPLLWFYFKTMTGQPFKSNYKLHFLLIVLDLVPYLLAAGFYLDFFPAGVFRFIDAYNRYIDVPRWISLSAYLYAVWLLCKNNRNSISEKIYPKLLALWRFFVTFQATWLLFLIPYLIPGTGERLIATLGWFPVYIPLTFLVYAIGALSFSIYLNSRQEKNNSNSYKKPLDQDEIANSIRMLRHAMETEQLYANPELNLSLMVAVTGLPQKTISAVLNQTSDKGFNGFVNAYRIIAFKEKVATEGTSKLTLTGIAMECGFSSQSTFQRVFKASEGISPSEYVNSLLKSRNER